MSLVHLTDSNFNEEVIEYEGLVLVDYWAPWCGPCRMLEPIVEEISVEMKDTVKVCKMNLDEEREIAGKYGIMSIPTLMLFKNGEVMESMIGLQGKESIVDAIKRNS
jgi:thioredoxin 1